MALWVVVGFFVFWFFFLALGPPCTQSRVPHPGKWLEMGFDEKTGQAAVIRHRARPEKCTGQEPVYTKSVPFIPFLFFSMLIPPKPPWSLTVPASGPFSKHPVGSLPKSLSALLLHPTPLKAATPASVCKVIRRASPTKTHLDDGFPTGTVGWASSRDGPGSSQVRVLLSIWSGGRGLAACHHSVALAETDLCRSESPTVPGQLQCRDAPFPSLGYWGFPGCPCGDDSLIA